MSNMKHYSIIIFVVALAVAAAGFFLLRGPAALKDGTYEASASGAVSPVTWRMMSSIWFKGRLCPSLPGTITDATAASVAPSNAAHRRQHQPIWRKDTFHFFKFTVATSLSG